MRDARDPIDDLLVQRPSTARYERLMGILAGSKKAVDQGRIEQLDAAFDGLAAVVEFLNSDPVVVKSGISTPLSKLMLALQDTIQGAKPSLLFDYKREEKKGGRPSRRSIDIMRGQIIAAISLLVEAGANRPLAIRFVGQELKRLRIVDPKGQQIRNHTLQRWWYEKDGAAPVTADKAYRSLSERAKGSAEEGGLVVDLAAAQALVKGMLGNLRLMGF